MFVRFERGLKGDLKLGIMFTLNSMVISLLFILFISPLLFGITLFAGDSFVFACVIVAIIAGLILQGKYVRYFYKKHKFR